ncbi:DUF3833 domain-containing protein [Shewanella waksmanii]|uniref:DUF3833 domain-containing protein n=1 Tax=Shewanella waksmanii TaxID=213783 RepID=UPI0037353334
MKKLLVLLMVMMVSSCSTVDLKDYANTTPELKLEEFFNGKLVAYGIVVDRGGKMLRRFEVDLVADWQGNKGEIKEWFRFDDGEKSTRIWQLEKLADNEYQGQANDVVGIARGTTSGSALYWQYQLDIQVDGETYTVTLDDWMYLLDDKRLFNKTDMSKFGFKVGEVVLYIEKLS